MTFTNDGKLVIDIKSYLKDVPDGVVKIEGLNANQLPLVFLNAGALESKQIFYATKALPNNNIEVTPYFFVPGAPKPPTYHFVLDISGSMLGTLPKLQKSVKELARELFIFQPSADVTITTFSNGIHRLGRYQSNNLKKLEKDVDDMLVKGDTSLYQVTVDFLEQITTTPDHNNILLFTDGGEGGSKPGSEEKVKEIIKGLGTELTNTTIRNKFYIFSYGVTQSSLMNEVAKTFRSDVIDTDSADFLNAQKDPELMKKWAAARELFVSRLVIEDKTGAQSEYSYSMALEQSGQLAPLKPRICKPGETLNISITDGDGKTVIQSTKKLDASAPGISFANLIADLGVNSANSQQKATTFVTKGETSTLNI